ncbi:hypothetical protein BV898_04600 [Hypsibius exemplaris]|uniref:SnoaL-like domain-containing protein n=1 Tax=Hypsibius exemplaris TaxID=2072580 RepID=A0A1W0X1U6_HYPEX|nr:hypothetical protein BV898_04600 [Hypsibius exemplaris]
MREFVSQQCCVTSPESHVKLTSPSSRSSAIPVPKSVWTFSASRTEKSSNIGITSGELNSSGRSMVDGVTQVTPATKSQTKANKALAKAYVEDILVNGRTEKLRSFFDGDNYIQHNPTAGDGVSGLIAAFGSATAKKVKYNRIRLVLGEGDFVLVASEGTEDGVLTALYDLIRVQKGKLAEHWDVIQAIPPRDLWNPLNNNENFRVTVFVLIERMVAQIGNKCVGFLQITMI